MEDKTRQTRTIGDIVATSSAPTQSCSVRHSGTSPSLTLEWTRKWPCRSELTKAFSPTACIPASDDIYRCVKANVPTLLQLSEIYGRGFPAKWIQIHISDLFAGSSAKDEELAKGIKEFSYILASAAKNYKLSEMLAFFGLYRIGRYDDSYQSFDKRRIGVAFGRFEKEIAYVREKHELERKRREREQRRFYPPEGYTPLEWVRHLRQRAKEGDTWAISQLSPEDPAIHEHGN